MAELEIELDIETDSAVNKTKKELTAAGKESGKSFGDSFKDAASDGFDTVTGLLETSLKFIAGRVAGLVGEAFLSARQEQAVKNLETSLRRIGEYTPEAVKDFEAFASSLQDISTFGDEVILEQTAIAQAYGATAEQSQRLVAAAVDLSAAQGKDLTTTTQQLSKTLGGYAGELGETVPVLKEFTQEQLRAGLQIDVLAKQFKGFSEDSVRTFGGAVKQTVNILGDLAEKDAEIITRNPEVIALIIATGQVFKNLITILDETNKSTSRFISDSIISFVGFIDTLRTSLSDLTVSIFNTFDSIKNISFDDIFSGVKNFGSLVDDLANKLFSFLDNTLGGFKIFGFSLRDMVEGVYTFFKTFFVSMVELGDASTTLLTTQFEDFSLSSIGFINNILDFVRTLPLGDAIADKITGGLEAVDSTISGVKDSIGETVSDIATGAKESFASIVDNETFQGVGSFIEDTGTKVREIAESLFVNGEEESIFSRLFEPFSAENIEQIAANVTNLNSKVSKQVKALAGQIQVSATDINAALENGVQAAFVGTFSVLGDVLVNGGNAFNAFLGVVLSALGDMAISIGTTVIGAAISIDALKKSLVGAPLAAIALGGALIAIGASLKAFSGSLGGSSSSSIPSASTSTSTESSSSDIYTQTDTEEREAASTGVTVNIQGDVFDSEDTGLRIANILENSSLNDNVRIVGALA